MDSSSQQYISRSYSDLGGLYSTNLRQCLLIYCAFYSTPTDSTYQDSYRLAGRTLWIAALTTPRRAIYFLRLQHVVCALQSTPRCLQVVFQVCSRCLILGRAFPADRWSFHVCSNVAVVVLSWKRADRISKVSSNIDDDMPLLEISRCR